MPSQPKHTRLPFALLALPALAALLRAQVAPQRNPSGAASGSQPKSGDEVVELVEQVETSLVTVLHTVPSRPTARQQLHLQAAMPRRRRLPRQAARRPLLRLLARQQPSPMPRVARSRALVRNPRAALSRMMCRTRAPQNRL